jgi:hypothetical protein
MGFDVSNVSLGAKEDDAARCERAEVVRHGVPEVDLIECPVRGDRTKVGKPTFVCHGNYGVLSGHELIIYSNHTVGYG